jgi:uncharacterized Tic20 family protein
MVTNPYAGPGGPQDEADPLGPREFETDPDARLWAMLCHLAALAGLFPFSVLFGFIVGPLIVWLMKKDTHPFVNDQGKEAINFQISMTIYASVAGLMTIIPPFCIGWLLAGAIGVVDIILVIIAGITAHEGRLHRYPFTIRFIK